MKKFGVFIIVFVASVVAFNVWKPQLGSYLLTQQLSSQAEVSRIMAQKDKGINNSNLAEFNNEAVDYVAQKDNLLAQISKAEADEAATDTTQVLGESDRWIEINLTQQRLYAWEGNNQVYNFLVSTGKWAPTPVGDYKVWIKLASTTMAGGSKALGTYYYLPNVPCTMYFYRGYGIHGAYWHNNFGQPMSHGCVNMRPSEACTLFNWSSVGIPVKIHY
ncbi:MAG: L,D-transpeptidase [Patescibacteria group bacterium]|nr:L,D-transpeptidase [Patescibacteria group bacterium]